jgi:hypothetical protein
MTAEEGFKTAMMDQIRASLRGDEKREERARSLVQRYRSLMEKKKR